MKLAKFLVNWIWLSGWKTRQGQQMFTTKATIVYDVTFKHMQKYATAYWDIQHLKRNQI